LGAATATVEATIFDFAAVSLAMHLPFALSASPLSRVAGWFADPAPLVRAARAAVSSLHERLLPAILNPLWSDDLSEEYLVFQLEPSSLPQPDFLLDGGAGWLAGLVRLEPTCFSSAEVREAIRLHLQYSPTDLFVPDWAAAVLLDRDCDETLQTIEFANLQLLEYRHIDNRLDDALTAASRLTERAKQSRLPLWRSFHGPLRSLGALKVEANGLFERTGNALKRLGDR